MATIFCCGAECGVTSTGQPSPVAKHWDSLTGTVASQTQTVRGNGSRAYQFSCSGTRAVLQRTLTGTPAVFVARAYVRFGTLPNIDAGLLGVFTAGAVENALFYDASAGGINARLNTTEGTAVPVVVGTWYRIEMRVNVSANPHTLDWRIDGVAQSQVTRAVALTTLADFRIGCGLGAELVTGTVYIDDLAVSVTSGDYPLGAGTCVSRSPVADGTHSFNAATDFKVNNTTNIAVGATNTFGHIDNLLSTTVGTFISTIGATGEYLEWTFGVLPGDVDTINGIEVVSSHHASGTAANTQTLRLVDGGSTSDVFADADFSTGANITMSSVHYAEAPSTGAWTVAKVNALKARWSPSFTAADITPVPFIDALMLEVDYAPVAATPWQLTRGEGCFTVDHLINFLVIPPEDDPPLGGAPQSAFVRAMGAGQRTSHVGRFMRGEVTDR